MLPSEFLEVQAHQHLKRLLVEHVDMQFKDLRTMLRLPVADLDGGCNFAAAAFIFNTIAGASVCFYKAGKQAFTGKRKVGRFKALLKELYPWDGEPMKKGHAVEILYDSARNPLAHSLGLEKRPATGHAPREVTLQKGPLTEAQIQDLEDCSIKPKWLAATVMQAKAPSGADRFIISVPTLYWGLHRMLHALFAHPAHVADADAIAKKYGPLWDKYVSVGDGWGNRV